MTAEYAPCPRCMSETETCGVTNDVRMDCGWALDAGSAAPMKSERERFYDMVRKLDVEHRPRNVWPEGRKDDAGKRPFDLVAPEFLNGLTDVLAFGAAKYGSRNWEAGMNWSRPFAALMRHMWDWWRGEKADPETGKSHLWHAACCLMFLVAYEARSAGTDDRPK